jgi:hypothetical protein
LSAVIAVVNRRSVRARLAISDQAARRTAHPVLALMLAALAAGPGTVEASVGTGTDADG